MELSIRTRSRIEIGNKVPEPAEMEWKSDSGEALMVDPVTLKPYKVQGKNKYGWYGKGDSKPFSRACDGCVFDRVVIDQLSEKYGSLPCADCTAKIGMNIYVKAK